MTRASQLLAKRLQCAHNDGPPEAEMFRGAATAAAAAVSVKVQCLLDRCALLLGIRKFIALVFVAFLSVCERGSERRMRIRTSRGCFLLDTRVAAATAGTARIA